MCVDCVLASPRITQVDPGEEPPSRGGSITIHESIDPVVGGGLLGLPWTDENGGRRGSLELVA
jgi:hypothetical protein